MAKANKKVTNTDKNKLMNAGFDEMLQVLDGMATSSEEIMPLFSASLELSIKIVKTYKKAFNTGVKYGK